MPASLVGKTSWVKTGFESHLDEWGGHIITSCVMLKKKKTLIYISNYIYLFLLEFLFTDV